MEYIQYNCNDDCPFSPPVEFHTRLTKPYRVIRRYYWHLLRSKLIDCPSIWYSWWRKAPCSDWTYGMGRIDRSIDSEEIRMADATACCIDMNFVSLDQSNWTITAILHQIDLPIIKPRFIGIDWHHSHRTTVSFCLFWYPMNRPIA